MKEAQRAETRTVMLPVTGMTCYNCVALIERQVRKLPAVHAVAVDLAGERLTVTFEAARLDERGLCECLERIGYGVATGRVELPVTGLREQLEAKGLQNLLASQSGVLAARVRFDTKTVALEFIAGLTGIAELAEVMRRNGYEVLREDALPEPADPEAEARAAAVHRQKRLLRLGLILTLPLVAFSMARDFGWVGFRFDRWAMLIPATLVQFGVGWQFYGGAYRSLRAGAANMDVLIVLGSSLAYFSSLAVTCGLLPGANVYFETGAAIITLIRLGKFLEARARGRASAALRALLGLRARTAWVLRNGRESEISLEQVAVGDTVILRPGERVAVDGIIRAGRSSFDETMITGESMPVSKGLGEPVIGGTINGEGLIQFEATQVGKHTTLARIVQMVQEAQQGKAPIQQLADQIGRFFVPAVVVLALLTFLGWVGVARLDWTRAMINAVAVLVIACPCAIGLAAPMAILVGMARGAKQGLLFKNSETMERAGRIQTVVLDKTGTITRGEPEVTDLCPVRPGTAEELLRLAASAERGSEHPLGRAMVKAARERGVRLTAPASFQALSGFGLRATVEDQMVLMGNARLMENEGIELAEVRPELARLQGEGKTVVVVAVKGSASSGPGRALGVAALADTVKPEARAAVAQLRQLGLDVVMLTGDHRRTAEAIAAQVGIQHVLAEVLPGDKVAAVRRWQAGGSAAYAPRSCAWESAHTEGCKSLPGGASRQTTERNCVLAIRAWRATGSERIVRRTAGVKTTATRTRYGLMRLTRLRAMSEVRSTAASPPGEAGAKPVQNAKHRRNRGAWGGWRRNVRKCVCLNRGDLSWCWKEQGRSQSPHSSRETGNDRGAKGGRKVEA